MKRLWLVVLAVAVAGFIAAACIFRQSPLKDEDEFNLHLERIRKITSGYPAFITMEYCQKLNDAFNDLGSLEDAYIFQWLYGATSPRERKRGEELKSEWGDLRREAAVKVMKCMDEDYPTLIKHTVAFNQDKKTAVITNLVGTEITVTDITNYHRPYYVSHPER